MKEQFFYTNQGHSYFRLRIKTFKVTPSGDNEYSESLDNI